MVVNPIDIVISTYRRGDKIDATIASIRQSTYTHFRLTILDQSEDDRTERCVARHCTEDTRIRYIRVPLSSSSATRNIGVQFASSPIVLFTNDDCTVHPDWIQELVREFQGEHVWMAFGRVLPGQPDSGANLSDQLVLAVKDSRQRRSYGTNRLDLGFGHGHNMAVCRERFLEIGGFDELLGAAGTLGSWDERDLGYRAMKQGGHIRYTPAAVVYHNHWQNWDGVERSYRNYGIGAGAAAAKYMRLGDLGGVFILGEWLFSQGLRQVVSGLIKWHSWPRARVGFMQLVYPWQGIARSLRYPLARREMRYLNRPVSRPTTQVDAG